MTASFFAQLVSVREGVGVFSVAKGTELSLHWGRIRKLRSIRPIREWFAHYSDRLNETFCRA